VALTTRQRNKLPREAFLYAPGDDRSRWRYPVPTKAQARAAGISEASRQRTAKAAVAYSARRDTIGSRRAVEPVARQRAGATPARRGSAPRSSARATKATRHATTARRGSVHRSHR
jgi:hypothetical protein